MNEAKDNFLVITLTREDVKNAGYNADLLSDEEMENIAQSIGLAYAEKDFERDIRMAAIAFGLEKL